MWMNRVGNSKLNSTTMVTNEYLSNYKFNLPSHRKTHTNLVNNDRNRILLKKKYKSNSVSK